MKRRMQSATAPFPAAQGAPGSPVSAATGTDPFSAPFLVITGRAVIREAVRAAAAAAGVRLRVAEDVQSALPEWDRSRAVIVGGDVLELPVRRRPVDALLGAEDDSGLWDRAAMWGVERVGVLPAAMGWLAEFLGGMGTVRDGGLVTGVWGASGGSGTSTLAVWLAAQAAEQGLRAVLVNTASQDTGWGYALSATELAGVGWTELNSSGGAISPERLANSLPQVSGFSVLTWTAGSVEPGTTVHDPRVLDAARKAYDLVILDLADSTLHQLARWCDSLTVCAPLTLNAAVRASNELGHVPVSSPGLVARAHRGRGPEAAELAGRLGLEYHGLIPPLRGVVAAADEGRLPALAHDRPVRKVVHAVLTHVGGGAR
ncbi:septum site-determining protein Ssd [Arthrobacter woluwensis]|uniref:septum site-determining protein Ssd n=1 Tax=Arthrobacter woluwensis TaxID=156980 RepID=UPI0027D8BAC6|nr:septum site-determining protein Ssd [Arthrobacter woluwensis]